MKGADVVVRCLENEGVDIVFAYPGGSSIDLHNAFTRSKKIRVILPRHEQGGGFMAHGYARSTGKVGVCMATSGPGAMNVCYGFPTPTCSWTRPQRAEICRCLNL